ncbi:MAG: ribulokinase [Ktedonobacterales bacterium]
MYTVGVDFGTESGRALLVDAETGAEIATAVHPYAHGVIDEHLPSNDTPLPPEWALQDPSDYLDVLRHAVPAVLRESGIDANQVAAIGIDFTSCTMLPTLADSTPLCQLEEWRNHPHAWVKLWKHHAAQPQADRINAVGRERGEAWVARYGGKYSSEWFFSKVLQILEEDPAVYFTAERFIEAADWLVWQLTGVETRNVCTAGYKAMVIDGRFPSPEFFAALDPRMANVVQTHLSRHWQGAIPRQWASHFAPLGGCAGYLTQLASDYTGLPAGITVAVANVDAHVTAPAVQVTEPGRMVMIMGTSTCDILLSDRLAEVEGMCGVVRDGVIPGTFGYEAGQSGVGDIFAWCTEHVVPPADHAAAAAAGLDLHSYLEREAARLRPGESGLLALDWWNGNRSILVDADLSGLLVGATLMTRAPAIYRALIEATAFGTRAIIQAFNERGIEIHELVAAGGLPNRNALLIQIYADVTGKPIALAGSPQAPALGSAMHAAVAAGIYPGIERAAAVMGKLKPDRVLPTPSHQETYDRLFADYQLLHDYFGRGENDVMKRLKAIRNQVLTEIPEIREVRA